MGLNHSLGSLSIHLLMMFAVVHYGFGKHAVALTPALGEKIAKVGPDRNLEHTLVLTYFLGIICIRSDLSTPQCQHQTLYFNAVLAAFRQRFQILPRWMVGKSHLDHWSIHWLRSHYFHPMQAYQ